MATGAMPHTPCRRAHSEAPPRWSSTQARSPTCPPLAHLLPCFSLSLSLSRARTATVAAAPPSTLPSVPELPVQIEAHRRVRRVALHPLVEGLGACRPQSAPPLIFFPAGSRPAICHCRNCRRLRPSWCELGPPSSPRRRPLPTCQGQRAGTPSPGRATPPPPAPAAAGRTSRRRFSHLLALTERTHSARVSAPSPCTSLSSPSPSPACSRAPSPPVTASATLVAA